MQFNYLILTPSFLFFPFYSFYQDDEGKKTSKATEKKGENDSKKTSNEEEGEEEKEIKMEDEPEQSENQAEILEEAGSHTEAEEALSADIVRADRLPRDYFLHF